MIHYQNTFRTLTPVVLTTVNIYPIQVEFPFGGLGGFIFVPVEDDPGLGPDVTLAIGVFPDGTWVRPVVGGVVGEAFDPDPELELEPDPEPDGSPATSATVMTRTKKIIVLLEFIILTENKI
jgi:hypothetical protein